MSEGTLELQRPPPAASEAGGGSRRGEVLVYVPTGEKVASLAALDRRLLELGWERYYDNPMQRLAQFCRPGTADLLSVPRHFSYLTAAHMRDVVNMNEGHFEVVDAPLPQRKIGSVKSMGSSAAYLNC